MEQTFEGHGFRSEGTENKVNDSLIELTAIIVVADHVKTYFFEHAPVSPA